jgi:hypothetical protein
VHVEREVIKVGLLNGHAEDTNATRREEEVEGQGGGESEGGREKGE